MSNFEEKEYLPDISNNFMNYYRVYDGDANNSDIMLKFPAQCKIEFDKYVQLCKGVNFSVIPSLGFKYADAKSKTILYGDRGHIKNFKGLIVSKKNDFEFCYQKISDAIAILILMHESDNFNSLSLFDFKEKISNMANKIETDFFQGIAQSKDLSAIKEFSKILQSNMEIISNMPCGLLHGKPELTNFFEHNSQLHITNFNHSFYGPAIWDAVVLLSDVYDFVDNELESIMLRDYYDNLVILDKLKVSLEEFYIAFKLLQTYYRLFRFVDDDNVDRYDESHNKEIVIGNLKNLYKTTNRYSEFNCLWNNISDIFKVDFHC